jgi:5-methylthioadenosine/S-adenosylhomocysteine deaminase
MSVNKYDLIIRNGWLITMDANLTRHPSADIAIDNGIIRAVGENLQGIGKEEINADGNVVMPGLIDAHMHTTLLRGVGDDLPIMPWLYDVMFPKDAKIQPRHIHAAAIMNQAEMIRGGVTTFLDIFRCPGEAALVTEESGLRGVFCPQIIDEPKGSGETLESNLAFIEDWHNRVPNRIFTWFGPHAPYSTSAETYRKVAAYAEEFDVGYHTHLCESQDELNVVQEKYGMSPVEFLRDIGALNPRLSIAHGVFLNPKDIQLLVEHDVGVAHCPSSNMKVSLGAAPVTDMLAAGVKVGLGTDSNLTNNNLDMFEEMRLAGFLQKLVRNEPSVLPCEQVLYMATMGSAACLGMEDIIGSLEVGKYADLIILDMDQPHLYPLLPEPNTNVIEHVVYSANSADVICTIVNGKILMQNRQVRTLDWKGARSMILDETQDLLTKADTWRRLGIEVE